MNQLTFGSLFAGIGGLDLGFERAGMECRWQVEIDPYCQRVLAKHWPNVGQWDDVRTFPPTPAEDWRVDVICGGFPCQDISNAGLRAGIEGERSGLWSEFARIVRTLRPQFVVVENVAALLNRGMGEVLGDLAACGYDAEWQQLPAASVGAPHLRHRIFIVAHDGRHYGNPSGASEVEARSTNVAIARGQRSLANASRELRHGSRSGATEAGRGQFAIGGKEIPNPRRPLLEERGAWNGDRGWRAAIESLRSAGGDWWAVEPAVGRVADGIPFGLGLLGGSINDDESDDQKTNSATCLAGWKVLRELWEHRECAAASPHILGNRLRDIVPSLPCNGGLARWVATAKGDEELRDMWERFYALPFHEAQDMQQALFERARAAERKQTMEFKSQRVNRLRGLGNAVVPQVAEWIGRRIIEANNGNHEP